MTDIKLMIFDCNGVLVDSEIIGIRIEVKLLRSVGFEIGIERFTERFSGMSWNDILRILEHESGLDLTTPLLGRAEAELDRRLPVEVEAVDGVHAILERLQYPTCV